METSLERIQSFIPEINSDEIYAAFPNFDNFSDEFKEFVILDFALNCLEGEKDFLTYVTQSQTQKGYEDLSSSLEASAAHPTRDLLIEDFKRLNLKFYKKLFYTFSLYFLLIVLTLFGAIYFFKDAVFGNYGFLSLHSQEPAEVFLNNVMIGWTNGEKIKLPAGEHELEIKAKGYQTKILPPPRLIIKRDQQVEHSVNLVPDNNSNYYKRLLKQAESHVQQKSWEEAYKILKRPLFRKNKNADMLYVQCLEKLLLFNIEKGKYSLAFNYTQALLQLKPDNKNKKRYALLKFIASRGKELWDHIISLADKKDPFFNYYATNILLMGSDTIKFPEWRAHLRKDFYRNWNNAFYNNRKSFNILHKKSIDSALNNAFLSLSVPKDINKAYYYLRETKSIHGMFMLSASYLLGSKGLKQIAEEYRKQALATNNPKMMLIANMYHAFSSLKIEPNIPQALSYFRNISEQASDPGIKEFAYHFLGALLLFGNDLPKIISLIINCLPPKYHNRPEIQIMLKQLTSYWPNIKEDIPSGISYLELAGNNGGIQAYMFLVSLFHSGLRKKMLSDINVDKSIKEAHRKLFAKVNSDNDKSLEYCKKAALLMSDKRAFQEFQFWLLLDERIALTFLNGAYKKGNKNAEMLLALLNLQGEALWRALLTMAKQGNPNALYPVGMIYLTGSGEKFASVMPDGNSFQRRIFKNIYSININKDIKKGIYWLEEAAKNNQPQVCFFLACIYNEEIKTEAALEEVRKAVSPDNKKAMLYYIKAARAGHKKAIKYLKALQKAGMYKGGKTNEQR